MKYCPECGFELKPGDEFCINCGAALDEKRNDVEEPVKKKKSFFKTPGGIAVIVIAALLVIAAIACIIFINTPKMKIMRAGYNTYKDLSDTGTAVMLKNVSEGGSIEIQADLKDITENFEIPFVSQIDATLALKYYMNSKEDSYELSASGALGGSNAIGVDLWMNPHRYIVKSPALIGKNAYGVDMSDDESRRQFEKLVKDYSGVDAEPYDDYFRIYDAYAHDKDNLNKKLGYKLMVEAFKNGKFETGKDEITIAGESQKTEVIDFIITGEQLANTFRQSYNELKGLDDFADVVKCIDEEKLLSGIDAIPKDYELTVRFYINDRMRVVRLETSDDAVNTVLTIGPDTADPKEFSFTVSEDGAKASIVYNINEDSEKEYAAHTTCMLSGKANILPQISLDYNDEFATDIQWNKQNGRWSISSDAGYSSDGEMKCENGEIKGSIKNVSVGEYELSPDIRFTVKEKDPMPSDPAYTAIRTDADSESFINDITKSIEDITREFLGNILGSSLQGIFGGEDETEYSLPEDLFTPEDEVDTEDSQQETVLPEAIDEIVKSLEEGKLNIGGVDISGLDLETIQRLLNMFGVDIDISGMDIEAIQEVIDSLGLGNIDIATIKGILSMLGVDTSVLDSIVPDSTIPDVKNTDNTAEDIEKKEQETESPKNDTIKDKNQIPTEGTYVYDDGNRFSINQETGEITYHVVCSANLKKDNTYSLKYSDGLMSYEDSGTFRRYSDNSMEFSSDSGIDATGEYYEDHLLVTIPGFGSISIPKK